MITKAVTIHGKNDLRLEEVNLPEVGPDDVQIRVVCDSICIEIPRFQLEPGDFPYITRQAITTSPVQGSKRL